MATDIGDVERNLKSFYNFGGKSVIHVGAGGGQLIGYSSITRSVLAVDIDTEAAARLKKSVSERGLLHLFTIEVADILSVSQNADVVFFEFCLHEISDPIKVLKHAKDLAPNTLIIDHHPESPWAWYICEDEKATNSWGGARSLNITREESYKAQQKFNSYSELKSKVEVMGPTAVERISEYINKSEISIEMVYTIALLE